MSSATRLYLSHDTSARAAGGGADAWARHPEVQLIRISSRGAFFLEPMVERDSPDGRGGLVQCSNRDDLPSILSGTGGTAVRSIPFLANQTRFTFANFGETEPLALDEYQSRGGLTGLEEAFRRLRTRSSRNCASRSCEGEAERPFLSGISGRWRNRPRPRKNMWSPMPMKVMRERTAIA